MGLNEKRLDVVPDKIERDAARRNNQFLSILKDIKPSSGCKCSHSKGHKQTFLTPNCLIFHNKSFCFPR